MKRVEDLSHAEVLSLAIAIEDLNARRFGEWSNRFRPFDEGLSRLFEDLMQEEKTHGDQLRNVYYSCFSNHVIPMRPEDFELPLEAIDVSDEHFFIVDHAMAIRLVQAALDAEERAGRFYEFVLARTDDPLLRIVYEPLAAFEGRHATALRECLQTLRDGVALNPPSLNDQ